MANNRQIAHLWAERNLTPGNSAPAEKKGSNFFYEDETIYSYGRHFPIARVVMNKKKQKAIVSQRPSTKAMLYRALRGRAEQVFEVVRVEADPENLENKENFEKRISKAFEEAARAKSHAPYKLEYAQEALEEANNFSKFFGLKWKFSGPVDLETLREQIKARQVKQAAELKKRKAASTAYYLEALKRWTEHLPQDVEGVARPAGLLPMRELDLPTMLRLEGTEVVTSRGARVPVAEAMQFLVLVEDTKAKGRHWTREIDGVVNVGSFQVEYVNPDGTCKIGCHIISGAELERFATILKGV